MRASDEASPFLRKVREAIRVRHYSIRTEEAYVQWVKRFIVFHGKRHPSELGEAEVATFLTHLAVVGNVASYTEPSPECVGVSLRQGTEPPLGRMRRHCPGKTVAAPSNGAYANRGRPYPRQLEWGLLADRLFAVRVRIEATGEPS